MSSFPYRDYKKYLLDVLKKSSVRGTKAALADAAGCQRSFLSQVIHGNVHLTLEHALGIARHLGMDSAETEYFYYLVASARSGSATLSGFYSEKMKSLKAKGEDLSRRLKHASLESISPDLAEYYSAWKFAAVHIACTIPSLRTVSTLTKRLALEPAELEHILNKLKMWGLIEQKRNEWWATKKLIHLPKGHFMTATNHRNWRRKNIELMESRSEKGINYTAVYSVSKDDFERLKEMTVQFLNQTRALVEASPEQDLVSFCLDCAKL